MTIRRTTYLAAAGMLAFMLAACAPKGLSPEAFVSQACLSATVAETSAEASMRDYGVVQSRLEEHQARLVEMQRMKSRIVTGRMGDEELAQWEPELLPWEEPAPEPEPEPVDTLPEASAIAEPLADTTGVSTDTLGASEFEAPSDTSAAAFDSDTTSASTMSDTTSASTTFESEPAQPDSADGATEIPSSEVDTPDESFDDGGSGTETETIESEDTSAPADAEVTDEPVEASSDATAEEEQPESDEQTASEDEAPPDGEASP